MASLSSATFFRNWWISFSSAFGFAKRDIIAWTCLTLLLVLLLTWKLSLCALASGGRFPLVRRALRLAYTLHAVRRSRCFYECPLVQIVKAVIGCGVDASRRRYGGFQTEMEGTTGHTGRLMFMFHFTTIGSAFPDISTSSVSLL